MFKRRLNIRGAQSRRVVLDKEVFAGRRDLNALDSVDGIGSGDFFHERFVEGALETEVFLYLGHVGKGDYSAFAKSWLGPMIQRPGSGADSGRGPNRFGNKRLRARDGVFQVHSTRQQSRDRG